MCNSAGCRARAGLPRVAAMSRELDALLSHLQSEREHVLAAVDGLAEDDLTRKVAPTGWSIAQLLQHLTYDDEIFWVNAILGADEEAIALVQDGWAVPVTSGADAVTTYRRWARAERRRARVHRPGRAPRWWPSADVFPFPRFEDARVCVYRVLVETATHAGHLDIVREGIDGHQHLVVS